MFCVCNVAHFADFGYQYLFKIIPLYSFYVASKFSEIIWVLMVIVLTKMKSPALKLRLKFVWFLSIYGSGGVEKAWPKSKSNLICMQYVDIFSNLFVVFDLLISMYPI